MKSIKALFALWAMTIFLANCSDFLIDGKINPDFYAVENSQFISTSGSLVITGLDPLLTFTIDKGTVGLPYEIRVGSLSGGDNIELSGTYPSSGSLVISDLNISTLSDGIIEIRYRYVISDSYWSEWLNNTAVIFDTQVSDYYPSLVFDSIKGSNTDINSLNHPLDLYSQDGPITINWSSSPQSAISSNGHIHPPPFGDTDLPVVLTATMSNGISELSKSFNMSIPSYENMVDITPDGYVDATEQGVMDSSGDSDIQPELQAVIDAAESGSDDVFIPSGVYLIENDIIPFDNLSLAGSPTGLTILQSATEGQILNLSQGTTGTKDNLLFKDLVFINVNFQFGASGEFFDNIRFENCIFVMDSFISYQSQLYCNDISQLEFINCAMLIQGPNASEQRSIYYYSSYNILLEDNIFGYDSSIVTEIQNFGSANMIDKLPKLQWLEESGFFSGDMRAADGDVLFRLFQDPSTYNILADNKVYNNMFFATSDADHIVALRLTATEIGGNYFHRDSANRSISLADSKNIVVSENYFKSGQVDVRSGYIGDLTDNVTDIYIFDNRFDGMGIFFKDSDDQPINIADVVFSANSFVQGTETITFGDTNATTGDYDLSVFTVDTANRYEAGGSATVDTGTLTGTLNTPASATIPAGNIPYFNPENYSNPNP